MSRQESRTGYARRVRRLAIVALLAGAMVGFSHPEPGLTDMVCGGAAVSQVKMSNGRADFGEEPHWFGDPANSGRLCWQAGGGVILEGRLYYDHLVTPGCAHIEVRFFNSVTPNPQLFGSQTYRDKVCSPGGHRQLPVYRQIQSSPNPSPSTRVGQITIRLTTSETQNGPQTAAGFKLLTRP
jgi:hypothetical protein